MSHNIKIKIVGQAHCVGSDNFQRLADWRLTVREDLLIDGTCFRGHAHCVGSILLVATTFGGWLIDVWQCLRGHATSETSRVTLLRQCWYTTCFLTPSLLEGLWWWIHQTSKREIAGNAFWEAPPPKQWCEVHVSLIFWHERCRYLWHVRCRYLSCYDMWGAGISHVLTCEVQVSLML